MKSFFLIAASLTVATAAIAQTTPPDAAGPMAAPAATPDMTPAPAPAADPAPMAAPADAAPAPMAAPADTSNYPRCSRTVHDKCVQKGGR